MPKRSTDRPWREYRLGMVVTAAITIVGTAIFVLGSTCGPFRPTVHTYHVDLDDVAGLRIGSIVRIGGIDAGEVTEIIIAPAGDGAVDPLAPGDTLPLPAAFETEADVHVALAIREPYDTRLTLSSEAQLASLGAGAERYVKITPGDPRERPLPEGAEIPVVPSVDWDLVLGRLARAFNELVEINALTEEIKVKLATRRGSLGLFAQDGAELYRQVALLQTEANGLMDRIERGTGFIALYGNDLRLQAEIDTLSTNIEAIRADVGDPNGAFQTWSEPEELRAALGDLRAEVARLDARLEGGHGSLGRFLNDQELFVQIRVLQVRISSLVAAFRDDPLGFVNIQVF